MTTNHQAVERVVYVVIPRELAGELHERLRARFANEPDIEVIVELRIADRRTAPRRRSSNGRAAGAERRGGGPSGRRVRQRRRPLLDVTPSDTENHHGIVFVERSVPTTRDVEDAETADLVARIQHGESELFSEVYLRYFDRTYKLARNFLDSHEAQDATQQAFLQALRALPRYDLTRAPFRIWLLTIVRNHAINQVAKLARAVPVEPEVAAQNSERPTDAQPQVLDWITDRTLASSFHSLPQPQRQVLILRYLLDLPHDQIARALHRRPDDIRVLHSRALRRLRSQATIRP